MSEHGVNPSQDKRISYYEDLLRRPELHEPEFDPLSGGVLLNLALTYDAVETVMARLLASHGMSTSAFNVLRILKRSGAEGRPLHEIGELLLTSRANVTGLVDCLEAKGLVQRLPDPVDRRSRRARLTDSGTSLIDEATPAYFRGMRDLIGELSTKDKSALVDLLVRLRQVVRRRAAHGSESSTMASDSSFNCDGD